MIYFSFIFLARGGILLALFGLDTLVQSVAVSPALQHTAAECIHDQDLSVSNDVFLSRHQQDAVDRMVAALLFLSRGAKFSR